MSRKTIDVAFILEKANTFLQTEAQPPGPLPAGKAEWEYRTPEARLAVASFLETILHTTGNYHGYNFLGWLNGGIERWEADGRPADTTPYLGDESRRVYYSSPQLRRSKRECPKGL